MPRMVWSSLKFDGVFILRIASSFSLVLLDSILSQNVFEEINLCLLELQLFRVQANVVLASGLEHFAEGLIVL